MRISFIVSRDYRAGTYFRYHAIAQELILLGHDVTVHTQGGHFFGTRLEMRNGVRYSIAPSFPGNRLVHFGTNPGNIFRRLLSRVAEAEVYHLFQPYPNAALHWLRLRRKKRGSAFLYDWDDLLLNDTSGLRNAASARDWWVGRWIGWMECNLPRHADVVTTLSEELTQRAFANGARRVELIHNGCSSYRPMQKAEARRELKMRDDVFYAGFMGWCGPEIEWILDAAQRLVGRVPNLRLAFSGRNPAMVTDIDKFPGIRERIDYFCFDSAEECRTLNSAIDLALIPLADIEFNRCRLPMKFHDHLAGGTRMLCCDVGEMGRIAKTVPGVVLCEPTQEAWDRAFAETVLGMQRGCEDLRPQMLAAAAALSWNSVAKQLETIYEGLLPSLPVRGNWREEEPKDPPPEPALKEKCASIIICTFNRVRSLQATLETVWQIKIPDGFSVELLVIDNGSDDGTAEFMETVASPKMRVRYVREPRRGIANARNRGLAEATGAILLFMDDDVRVPEDWLCVLCEAIAAGKDAVSVG